MSTGVMCKKLPISVKCQLTADFT